jgi:hypothetical protein
MRVTRDALIKIAHNTVARYLRKNRSISAAYLCGSLLGQDYQIGGAADIDLVFVHADNPPAPREIIPLSEDIHLDIAHHSQEAYRTGKQIRVHAWLGPTLNTAMIVHDPRHMLDFIQASVRGQFEKADHVFERAQTQLEQARSIWSHYQPFGGNLEIDDPVGFVHSYVRALGHAANAVASLSGPPLTERRLLLEFQQRAEAIGQPGLYPGLLGLLGWPYLRQTDIQELIEQWRWIYQQASEKTAPPRVVACRENYYAAAFASMREQQKPEAILWPALRTATLIMVTHPENANLLDRGADLLNRLGLGAESLPERLAGLDAYLDLVEETLEGWAQANGVLSAL